MADFACSFVNMIAPEILEISQNFQVVIYFIREVAVNSSVAHASCVLCAQVRCIGVQCTGGEKASLIF